MSSLRDLAQFVGTAARRVWSRRWQLGLSVAILGSSVGLLGVGASGATLALPATGEILYRGWGSFGSTWAAVDPYGNGEHQVAGSINGLRFSPDASELVFAARGPLPGSGPFPGLDGTDRDVWRMNSAGTGLVDLTADNPNQDYPRAWSRDGTMIAFQSLRDIGGSPTYGVYVMNADGTDIRLVAPGFDTASFSPDGSRLVVGSADQGNGGSVEIVNLDGTVVGNVAGGAHDPQWSPDGTRIAYVANQWELWVVNIDGGGARRLDFAQNGQAFAPAWSPDSSEIAYPLYFSDKEPCGAQGCGTVGSEYAYVISATGGDRRQVSTDNSSGAGDPIDWLPVDVPTVNVPQDPLASADTTPPSVIGSTDRSANAAGWYNAPVTITWSSTDPSPSSGAPSTPPSTAASTEGFDVIYTSGPSCDPAGNCATGSLTFSIDETPPSIAVGGVSSGGVYTVGSVPAPSCVASDPSPGSGLASPAVLTVSGGNPDSTGTLTATCAVSDVAGNGASASASYSVHYAIPGGGFQGNVNNPPLLNTGKAGKNYPVQWQIEDATGAYVTSLSVVLSEKYKSVDCAAFAGDPTDALVASTSGSSGLRYDSTANKFLYNWKTPTTAGCYEFYVTLVDGNVLTADFKLT